MVVIIDYGVGNLVSIRNMLKKAGVEAKISEDLDDLRKASKLILPGVGHFDHGMNQLHKGGFVEALNEEVLTKKKVILGICLGAQLLTESSEEGSAGGLGWIKGKTVRFNEQLLSKNEKVPHMGWSELQGYSASKLFNNMYEFPRFYFVHSYHLELVREKDILCKAHYGYDFIAGIEHENILGVQFHPEKSHKFGMKLLENFVKYY